MTKAGFLFTLLLITLMVRLAYSDSMDLIKDGQIAAVATAFMTENEEKLVKDRLFKLTVMINDAFIQLSGDDDIREEKLSALKNRIRVQVVPDFNRDVYMLSLESSDQGKELTIAGNTIDHTERAVYYFLSRYMSHSEITDLEGKVDRAIEKSLDLPQEELIIEPAFHKVKDMVFEQDKPEIRKVVKPRTKVDAITIKDNK